MLTRNTGRPPLLLVLTSVGYAALLREWNRLEEADTYVHQALELGRQAGRDDLIQDSLLMQASIEQARGNIREALELLHRIEPQIVQGPSPLVAGVATVRARLSLACGQLEEALRWEREYGLRADDPIQEPLENTSCFDYLTLARVLIAKGQTHPTGPSLSQALNLLESLHSYAERTGFTGWVIQILTLKALALQAQGATQ